MFYASYFMQRKYRSFSSYFQIICAFFAKKHKKSANHRKMISTLGFWRAFYFLVPRPGIEPGWIAPLVFETSASTDSAIWA